MISSNNPYLRGSGQAPLPNGKVGPPMGALPGGNMMAGPPQIQPGAQQPPQGLPPNYLSSYLPGGAGGAPGGGLAPGGFLGAPPAPMGQVPGSPGPTPFHPNWFVNHGMRPPTAANAAMAPHPMIPNEPGNTMPGPMNPGLRAMVPNEGGQAPPAQYPRPGMPFMRTPYSGY